MNKLKGLNDRIRLEMEEMITEATNAAYRDGYEQGKLEAVAKTVKNIGLVRKSKSANQQRAELIEKAKKFVDEKINPDWKGYLIKIYAFDTKICNAEFIRKGNRVTCLLRGTSTNTVYGVGRANCVQGEVFNERIGEAISLAKALKIDIPVEFLEAVQPTFKIGQVVTLKDFPSERFEVKSHKEKDVWHLDNLLECEQGWDFERNLSIIDDTNAQYEVTS